VSRVSRAPTALGVRGEPEWAAAFLVNLGLPMKEAIAVVDAYGDMAIDGDARIFRVCGKCAAKAGLPAPVLAIEGQPIPLLAPRE
jgi:hypothetical protein